MNLKTAYTIVAIAPPIIQQKCDALKRKIDLYKSEIKDEENNIILKHTAHFAIKRTFSLKGNISENEFIENLKDLSFPKVEIKCEESGLFEQSNYGTIVFVKADLTKELLALHFEIKKLIDNLVDTRNPEYEGKEWRPHITFTYNTPADRVAEVKTTVDKELLPVRFDLDKLYLLREYNTEKDEREVLKVLLASQGLAL